ncbi:MAG: DUF1501 domain-containing protein, partial [Planctomycetota bacterium]
MARERQDQDGLASRRRFLGTGLGLLGLSLPDFLHARSVASKIAAAGGADPKSKPAKSCIVLFAWGGLSHFESFDPKPDAPKEIRGQFSPIETATSGIQFSEHIPLLAKRTERLAVIRSMHHGCSAHGKAMYWNMTGHAPPNPGTSANLPPSETDWPSLPAVVTKLRGESARTMPAIRLPYPLVDNGTLQAGEYGGWLGSKLDPVVVRTPKGKPFNGVSRDLGSPVFNVTEKFDRKRLRQRIALSEQLGRTLPKDAVELHDYFHNMAADLLLGGAVREAFELEREDQRVREKYGDHLCGQSALLARRLTEVGVPIVTVACSAGDLNGSKGQH